jgi:flagellar protein FlaI
MGLFDKIKKKPENGIKKEPTAGKAGVDRGYRKSLFDNDDSVLDVYTVEVDDVTVEVGIKNDEGYMYYIIPEIERMKTALSRLSKDHLNLIRMQITELGLVEYKQIKEFLANFSIRYDLNIPYVDNLAKYFYLTVGKLGLLEIPINDGNLEEIMVNGYNLPIYVFHRKFQMCETNIILDKNEVDRVIENIANLVNRPIDSRVPMLDAFLPDGSRVNATTADVTMNGATLTIRKFSKNPLTVIDLINFGSLDIDTAAFLWQAVEGYFGSKPANTLIVGGTGSGKTTLLNVLSLFSMYNERIITIEDTPELQIPHKHVIKMVTRPARPGMPEYEITMDDLIKNALRMRPDRIFVGEVRGEEARSLLVAMNTGHDGALISNENILLSDGEESIGKFVDDYFNDNRKIHKEHNNFEWINVEDEEIYIKSFNKSSIEIEEKLVSRVWRKRYKGTLIKIKTDSDEIILTHDHPVYIKGSKDDNIIFEVNAEMVKEGNFIGMYEKGIIWENVEKVEYIKYNGYIYDLTVNDNHTYIASNFLVSNCSGTLHANSCDEAILRLKSPPMNVPEVMLKALNFIINQQRVKRGGKTVRRILEVMEIVRGGSETGGIAKTTLYEYNGIKDALEKKSICMWEEEVCEMAGITRDELLRDRENRKRVLAYLYKNNIRKLEDVARFIMAYQADPEKLLNSLL